MLKEKRNWFNRDKVNGFIQRSLHVPKIKTFSHVAKFTQLRQHLTISSS